MKKIKKILIPLLVVMCIPLFLTGCGSSNNGILKSSDSPNGKIWYGLGDNQKDVTYVLWVKNDKISYVGFSTADSVKPSDIQASTPADTFRNAVRLGNKINSRSQSSFAAIGKNVPVSIKSSSKQEYISFKDDQGLTLTITKPNIKVKKDGKTYIGYDYVDYDKDSGYLVTVNTNKLGFDKSTN